MLSENNVPYATFKILLVIVGTLGMMCSTTKFKYRTKRILTAFILYLCYAAIYAAAINSLFGYLFFMRTVLPAISAPAIFLIFRLAGDQPSKSVFNYATQLLCSLYISGSITLFIVRTHSSGLTECLILTVTYGVVIFLEYRFVRRPLLHIFSDIDKGWLILAMVPCSLAVLAVVLGSYPVHFTESSLSIVLIYLLGSVIIIIYFAIFQFLLMQYRFQSTRHDMEILKIQNETLKEKMALDAAATEQSLIDKHDTRHRLQTIASLLERGQTSEAIDYITQSVCQINTEPSVTYCKDILLNATLSSYFGQAKKTGIVLETHLSFPDTLSVDSGEFSIVVANALENAIKACSVLPEEERRIICKCISKPKLMLEISNPCKGDVVFSDDGVLLSGGNEHGIGTRSIMAFCKKYGALCSFSVTDKWFVLKIVL